MNNIGKSQLTEAEREQIFELVSQIENILRGKLIALTAEERRQFGSIKEKNKLLVEKVRHYRQHSPSMSSPDIDWEEFESDYRARAFFERLLSRFNNLVYQVESAKIVHDYDNHSDSRKEYTYTKYKSDIDAGYSYKASELKQFFNRSGTGLKGKSKNNDQDE
jgi:hypothetical protein